MRESEYKRLKAIFENDGRLLPAPKKTYGAMSSELQSANDPVRAFLYFKTIKTQTQSTVVCSLEEQYTAMIKCIPRNFKQFYQNYQNISSQNKKIAIICAREAKRSLSRTSKTNPTLKSKRINRELNVSIKKSTRDEVNKQKREEREEELKKKKEEEEREELRQKRKFNYLMSQTEAFASFFLNKRVKIDGSEDENVAAMKAAEEQLAHLKEFDDAGKLHRHSEKSTDVYEYQSVQQPKVLKAKLKDHQLKGLNWLVNLYNQGINGILADDMGLGKTIQSISLLSHLYENEGVYGPFLIITPSSTLHNWSNELERFVPTFKVVNYWGNVQERKDMRKTLKKHNVVITSYQIAVSDEAIISKIKWQYMILDEAQAIKSINSQRWKILLGFKSRSRLLLTGTPIQNNMQELWSLLHFIMPTLFDSLSEFSEWFSKDIESKDKVEEEQISKLHTILKPFMLRRNKNDIKDEIGGKEIITLPCEMSNRQRILYDEILNSKLDYENILMQLKKVCNHPDLFEKLEPICSFSLCSIGENGFVGYRSYFKRLIPNKVTTPVRIGVNKIYDVDLLAPFPELSWFIRSFSSNVRLAYLTFERNVNNVLFNDSSNEDGHCMRLSSVNGTEYDEVSNCKQLVLRDVLMTRILIEHRLNRFKLITEKIFDKHETTNLDKELVMISEHRIDRYCFVPPLNTFISDSGKLVTMDALLKKLKKEGHRVLIYFQMTRMMDLFEEYLIKREYNYLRLDGSSKISQRKELVEQWQTDEDMFVFILSTRAGGVGINLTAADTVIFYDNDWNPTVDQQAMDRVHRLGQTKDVTVYRLITQNSVEEKVMERANKKEEVQKIVIKGNVFEGQYLDQ